MLLVIHEIDLTDDESTVIGIADSIGIAENMIGEYYGNYKQIHYRDIRDSNLEYSKILEVAGAKNEFYRVKITLEWFELNKI